MSRTGRERSDAERVVVTGIGLLTGLGLGREETWANLCAGHSAARPLDKHSPEGLAGEFGCPVPTSDDGPADRPGRIQKLLLFAALEALRDARLWRGTFPPERMATLIGLSKGDVQGLAQLHNLIHDPTADPETIARLWLSGSWPYLGATYVAKWADARGPILAPVAACATGLVAVLQGADLIRRGACDVALAGAADASLEPWVLAAFRRMRALARVEPGSDPSASVRPLDRNRSGFLVGEGAAVLVLERADHARARGAAIHAEVAGGALGSDAYHLTDLNLDPSNLAQLIGRALENSGTDATEIDHVNLHGTATRPNDPLESQAVRAALGSRADEVLCTANKAQIGHLLGAAGAAELALTCLALRDGLIPPTLNRNDPDPACPLATSPVSHPRPIRAALKLSLGFGGHLAVAVLRRPGSS